MSVKKANFDTLRSRAFGVITGSYAAVGSATTILPRIVLLTNDTDAGMIFSTDNTNSTGMLYLAKGTFKLFDLTANIVPGKDDNLELPIGTVWYVKQVSAPGSGAVYVEYMYGS